MTPCHVTALGRLSGLDQWAASSDATRRPPRGCRLDRLTQICSAWLHPDALGADVAALWRGGPLSQLASSYLDARAARGSNGSAVASQPAGIVASAIRCIRSTNLMTSEAQYLSGHWHHDGEGHRLKAFVFLSDVDAASRPTRIAAGTHDTFYWSYAGYGKKGEGLRYSRFSEQFVAKSYDVHTMTGPRGGGFVFDTNTVHKGEVRGSKPRDVLMIELSLAAKCRRNPDLPRHRPYTHARPMRTPPSPPSQSWLEHECLPLSEASSGCCLGGSRV